MEMSVRSNAVANTQPGPSFMPGGTAPRTEPGRLRIRYGRACVALVGAVALLSALASAPLAVASVVPVLVPVTAAAVFVLLMAGLRIVAVRGRRHRVNAAFADAMAPVATDRALAPAEAEPRRNTALFDAETAGGPAAQESTVNEAVARPDHQRLTAAELRQAALTVAAGDPVAAAPAGAPWQPVDVPKPMYVEAPKAERQAPMPLDLPESPKPQLKTPLKQTAPAPAVDSPAATPGTSPSTGKINLDDVLQRRRA